MSGNAIEDRLRRQLNADAAGLPPNRSSAPAAIRDGRRRRRRSLAATAAGGCLLVTALGFGTVRVLDRLDLDDGTVIADAAETGDPGDPGDPIDGPTGDDPASEREDEPEAAPETTAVPGPSTTTFPPLLSSTTTSPSTTAASAGSDGGSTGDAAGPSTADVIDRVPGDQVLFHADHEGCGDRADERFDPDWTEGQAPFGDERNEDGTPTYGFGFHSGVAAPIGPTLSAQDVHDPSQPGPAATGGSAGPDADHRWGFVETELARSGRCALAMTLLDADTGDAAVRLFRRYDRLGRPLPDDAYYSVWLYLPEEITFEDERTIDGETVFGFWNLFQIKNDIRLPSGDRESLSAFSFQAGRTPDQPFMSLGVFSKVGCGDRETCDAAGPIRQTDPVPLPTGRWIHLELHLLSRPDGDGRIEVWQDGRSILRFDGPTERPDTERRTWALTSAGRLHRTATHTVLADDPAITSIPIHPLLFDR